MNSYLSPHLIVGLLLGLCSFFIPLLVSAESAEPAQNEQNITQEEPPKKASSGFFDQEHRRRLYEQNRLSTTRAALYSLALPGLGNFYVEQYALGIVAMSAFVFSAIFLSYGLINNHPDLVWIGGGLAVLAYGGGATSSVLGVRAYNERLRQSLHLQSSHQRGPRPAPTPAAGIGWRWSF